MPTSSPQDDPSRRVHRFGAFDLLRLLGKSAATMTWLARDRDAGHEVMLSLPRAAPASPAALGAWFDRCRRAARLEHPNLADIGEIGVHEHWPFVAVPRAELVTLEEWCVITPQPTASQVGALLCSLLRGLAYAHEAGLWHGDLQFHNLVVDRDGRGQVMALGVSDPARLTDARAAGNTVGAAGNELRDLQIQRVLAERDVLASGLVLHRLLAGEPPFGQADFGRSIERLAPLGHDVLRLPWRTPVAVPEPLRAIANRATSSQERLRYRSARTLLGAVSGWHAAASDEQEDPVKVLLGRIQSAGHLPALPGLPDRVASVLSSEGTRTDDIANQILGDPALSLELLRRLNTARLQSRQGADKETVLTLRRVVALIGVDGVRQAAHSLRAWPGGLDEDAADKLRRLIEHAVLAGYVAQRLRPAGYDPEVVFLIAVLQNLGRLLLRYHLPEEARQIEQLMQPAPTPPGMPERAGLSEESAACSVLGVDVPSLGLAVARHWGLGAEVLEMMRRVPLEAAVRKPDDESGMLRVVASAANEAVELVTSLPVQRLGRAMERLAERHVRVLRLTDREIKQALREGRDALRKATGAGPRGKRFPALTEPAELNR